MILSVIFDGNNMFHREFASYASGTKNIFKNRSDEIIFLKDVAGKFFNTLNSLPINGEVVFCRDSSSWRKNVEIEGGGYKSTRKKKSLMDDATRKKFYALFNDFVKLLKNAGIIVSEVGGAEADDLIYKWSNYFIENNHSAIIASSDKDLNQLVKFDGVNWIVQWTANRKSNKLYIPEGWKDGWLRSINEVSVFDFNPNDCKRQINDFIDNLKLLMVVVYPDESIITKILGGDSGDDVPSVWTAMVMSKKGTLTPVKMTGKKIESFFDALNEKGLSRYDVMSKWADPEFMDFIAGLVLRLTRDVDGRDERQAVIKNLYRNATLMWLNDEVIPINLNSNMAQHIKESIDGNVQNRSKWNGNDFFKGSDYDKEVVPSKFDPFYGMDDPGL